MQLNKLTFILGFTFLNITNSYAFSVFSSHEKFDPAKVNFEADFLQDYSFVCVNQDDSVDQPSKTIGYDYSAQRLVVKNERVSAQKQISFFENINIQQNEIIESSNQITEQEGTIKKQFDLVSLHTRGRKIYRSIIGELQYSMKSNDLSQIKRDQVNHKLFIVMKLKYQNEMYVCKQYLPSSIIRNAN